VPSETEGTLSLVRVDQRYRTYRTAIRTIGWIAAAFIFLKVVHELAGRTTEVSVSTIVSILADIKFAVAITFAGGATIWALVERALRHRKVETMQGRIRQLEQTIDPNRTSSGLTPQGRTNPGDLAR
jgi:hypothetical protein